MSSEKFDDKKEYFFETKDYRAPKTKEEGAGYWYDVDKITPQKVLKPGLYKDYHGSTAVHFHKFEAHQNRPEMLKCDQTMNDLETCMKKYVHNNSTAQNFQISDECKPLLESFKVSCGMRRLKYISQLQTVFRYDLF